MEHPLELLNQLRSYQFRSSPSQNVWEHLRILPVVVAEDRNVLNRLISHPQPHPTLGRLTVSAMDGGWGRPAIVVSCS